jgi:tight adherence protein C
MPAQLVLIAAIVFIAAAVVVLVMGLAPDTLPEPPTLGRRGARRKAMRESSDLFRWFEPVIRLCTYHVSRIKRGPLREWLGSELVQAGEPGGFDADEYLSVIMTTTIMGASIGAVFFALANLGAVGGAIMCSVIGVLFPVMWLTDHARERMRLISQALPYALDLMALALSAGIDFVAATRHVVDRTSVKNDPLREELSRLLAELQLGRTRADALTAMAERAPAQVMRAFVSSVVEAEKRGVPLADALKIQSDSMRTARSQNIEKRAGKAAVLILMPLTLIFFATFLVLFGGTIIRAMRGNLF